MISKLISAPFSWKSTRPYLGMALAVILLRCLWLWQPERQIQLHQDHLLDAAESRNWTRFSSLIDERYSDRWEHDKKQLVRESSEVLRHFFGLRIERTYQDLQYDQGKAAVKINLKLKGSGTPIATLASERVNALSAPFTFHWEKQSWKPWDWQLVGADQPELTIPTGETL